ncbi:MAG TPA: hypothetical protein VHE61_18590 [Opitutaceae bacterium]|nr:hypothetical protein [Opitutaceae bacterium]
MRRTLAILPTLLVAAAFAVAVLRIDRHRRELTREAAHLRTEQAATTEKRAALRRESAAVAHAVVENVRREAAALKQARVEVATLEARALTRHSEIVAASKRRMAEASAPPTSHNPEQGFTRLEYFHNVGRMTPAAAFQTLVWAALHGDDATLAAGLCLDSRAGARAAVLLASLPDDARAQSSPAKLAALWWDGTVLDVPAAQIIRQETQDDAHATLLTRGGIGGSSTLNFQLGPTGWQLVVPERALESIQSKVIGYSPPLPQR